jgi:hypothetical protein
VGEREHLRLIEGHAATDRETMACRGEFAPVEEFADPRGRGGSAGGRAARGAGRGELITFRS